MPLDFIVDEREEILERTWLRLSSQNPERHRCEVMSDVDAFVDELIEVSARDQGVVPVLRLRGARSRPTAGASPCATSPALGCVFTIALPAAQPEDGDDAASTAASARTARPSTGA